MKFIVTRTSEWRAPEREVEFPTVEDLVEFIRFEMQGGRRGQQAVLIVTPGRRPEIELYDDWRE